MDDDGDFMDFMKKLNDNTNIKHQNLDKELAALMNEPDVINHKNNDSSI